MNRIVNVFNKSHKNTFNVLPNTLKPGIQVRDYASFNQAKFLNNAFNKNNNNNNIESNNNYNNNNQNNTINNNNSSNNSNNSNTNNNNNNNNNNNSATINNDEKKIKKPVGPNSNSLQKAMLLVNIKDLFKKRPLVATDLISRNLKQGNLNNHDMEILFQWSHDNKYLNHVDIIHLFLSHFTGVNDISRIKKLIVLFSFGIEMDVKTCETLIKYFTISKMHENLKSILESCISKENGLEFTKKTYQEFITSFLELDDIEGALKYYPKVKPETSSWLEIVKYYIKKGKNQDAINFFKMDAKDHKESFFLSGTFSSLMKNFSETDSDDILSFLLETELMDENSINLFLSMHLENSLKTSSYLIRKWSRTIPMEHLYTKLVKQTIIVDDLEEILTLIQDKNIKNLFTINIPTYAIILEMADANQRQEKRKILNSKNYDPNTPIEISWDSNFEQIINHITSLDPKGNELSSLIFYAQIKEKTELFQMLTESLNNQKPEYIDKVTCQLVKHFTKANHYDLAMAWIGNRLVNYNFQNNAYIYHSLHEVEASNFLGQFWFGQLSLQPIISDLSHTESSFKIDQMMILLESSLQEHEERNRNNSKNKPIDSKDIYIKRLFSKSNIDENLVLENLEMNKEVNLQLEQLLKKKIENVARNGGTIKYEGYRSTKNYSTNNWLPKEFSNSSRYVLSEYDAQLKMAIDNNNADEIYEVIKKSLADNVIPESRLLLTAYYFVCEYDRNKYIQLLQETPPFVRMLIFNTKFYYDLLKTYPDVAIFLLQGELPQNLSPVLLYQILFLTLKSGRIDLFTTFGTLLMATNTPINLESIIQISKTLIDNNISIGNSKFVVKFIEYIKSSTKIQSIIKEGNDLKLGVLLNSNELNFRDFKNIDDYNHRMSFAYTILLNELSHANLSEEIMECFSSLDTFVNNLSIEVVLKHISKLYPIPPLSNITQWLSLIQYCKSPQQKNKQYGISVKLLEKDPSITESLNYNLFNSIVSHVPNLTPKLLISLFLRVHPLLPQKIQEIEITDETGKTKGLYSTQKIKSISPETKSNALYQIDQALNMNPTEIEEKQLKEWINILELIPLSSEHSLEISNDSLNIITQNLAPKILSYFQSKNSNLDLSQMSQLSENTSPSQRSTELKNYLSNLIY
ncbi:hypothetical protein DICPUDRAFT_156342 [Dictyostelium purpureum]|uniref:Uncharacterized protein n=1 Tax=Dictyostelium purpureum TaxID=5786 RepID=F0ZWB8_DICPU|nr:uncharacterized protein DICPUDRAFT_156342 [Dictyostelium purpureum]EGC31763.1 hypothetical protein DICPUDRAFT_156342 [Dictyostelium purpureum]|eukprot:XP_003291714.1 hypothetical protein DICPUDRAFT_156342 [Dictyostelium purpureum]